MIWGVYETSFILFSIIFLDNVKKMKSQLVHMMAFAVSTDTKIQYA